jgi:hypothetical protein
MHGDIILRSLNNCLERVFGGEGGKFQRLKPGVLGEVQD